MRILSHAYGDGKVEVEVSQFGSNIHLLFYVPNLGVVW